MTHVKAGPSKPMDGKTRSMFEPKEGQKTHYFLTVMDTKIYDDGSEGYKSTRCWGYDESFDRLVEALENNYTDIHECTYDWAVVEEHIMSFFAVPTGRFQWFKWNEEKEGYEQCDPPEWSHGIISWGIG